jgi:tryptophanyl-tRNA synthetase
MTSKSKFEDTYKKALTAIEQIKETYSYQDITSECKIAHLDNEYLATKFSCHDNLQYLNEVSDKKKVIVTGFGPTNSPTAGTLSVLLKTISLQRETGYDTEIIISNLGAYLSRNVEWDILNTLTKRFVEFIHNSGFNQDKGRIRTHIDKENLGISTFVSENILTTEDFNENKEATENLYGMMNLLGPKFGIITDSTYTVSDIIKPLFRKEYVKDQPHEKERVLVVAGIEEHYFPRLAKIAINRINEQFPSQYICENAKVSALYTRLISGLNPYPKMSKSIPDSAINIGDSVNQIKDKIMKCSDENEIVILEMITQASNWSYEKISSASIAYQNRFKAPNAWKLVKEDYTMHFIEISKIWHKACQKYPISTREN